MTITVTVFAILLLLNEQIKKHAPPITETYSRLSLEQLEFKNKPSFLE